MHNPHREKALALLTSDMPLTRKAGSFLGQLVVDPAPMTEAQREWFGKLMERAGLGAAEEDAHG